MTSDNLDSYRAKRSADRTPEPFGGARGTGGLLFVVQKHYATRLHYDFRLEHNGVLKSWAVPRGPSYDQADKRLAVQTEDHPIEYADFEGIIPEGNYGAGAVIVWDRGLWIPREDFDEGLEKGKLLFELRGYKLHGAWTLVRLKKGNGTEWLMIKERDAWMTDEEAQFTEHSVFSGLTVEELKAGRDLAGEVREALDDLGAKKKKVKVRDVGLMLAQTREHAFTDQEWLFELKYDGYRMLAARAAGASRPALISRNGHDLTAVFPDVSHAVGTLPYENFVLDGEVVVHDDSGRPSFQRLQKRGRLTGAFDIRRATVELPASLYAFDLVSLERYDLRALPLIDRKNLLHRMLPPAGPIRFADHVEERGSDFYDQVEQMGLEGIVAKKSDSRYRAGRSSYWLKIRIDRSDDFVIVGFSDLKGSTSGFGALHLGSYIGGELTYAGRVGTGFTAKQRDEIRSELEEIERKDPPHAGPVPKGDEHHWVEPEMVVEVRYKEWTADSLLRHPAFLRFRDDKNPKECVRQHEEFDVMPPPETLEEASVERVVPFSNLDKVFWPEEGYTKGDMIEYYRAASEWLLPYVQDRPVVMTRYPDGIDGKSFFQKDAPQWVPDWVRTQKVWSPDSGKETNYFIGDDVETILYLANMGSIPLHVWSSRLSAPEQPDWCILDLDPKEAPFDYVVRTAREIRAVCAVIELSCFIKTSGSTGLHVLLPLGGQCTYEQSKVLGQLLATVTAARIPDIATIARALPSRQGRVYIDFVQNGHGKLLVSPLCVRPLPGAPVSMPLKWSEVNGKLDIRKFNMKNAPKRIGRMKEDPMRGVLNEKPDLPAVLDRLAELVAAAG